MGLERLPQGLTWSRRRIPLRTQVQDVRTGATGPRTYPLGWAALPLFSGKGELNHGLWCLKLLHPPVRFGATLGDLALVMPTPHLKIYCRLVSANPAMLEVHDRFIVNPEATKMQYSAFEYGSEARPPAIPPPPPPPPAVPPLQSLSDAQEEAAGQHSAPGAAAGSPARKRGRAKNMLPGEREHGQHSYLELLILGVSGALSGHKHCEQRGGVYLRASLVDTATAPSSTLDDVTFTNHPTADLRHAI